MELEYEQLLSPVPLKLSLGVSGKFVKLRKPTLLEIDTEITISEFCLFETFLKMTPETCYNKILNTNENDTTWESLSDEVKEDLTLYSLILSDKRLQETYLQIFNFFFEETIIYKDGYFFFLNPVLQSDVNVDEINNDDILGVIGAENLQSVLNVIQQTCCIYSEEKTVEAPKFKNKKAQEIYAKIEKAERLKEEREKKKGEELFSIANIISSVSNRHPSLNPVNIWDLTIYQLYDSFNRMQLNAQYSIECTRLSVWGDEDKTFNASLWYKNISK